MIENYFKKSEKRKHENRNEEKKATSKEPLHKRSKTELEGEQIPEDISTILLPHVPVLNWKEITGENLHLSYAVLFSLQDSRKIFNHLEKEIVYDKASQVQVFGKWYKVPRKQASYGDAGLTYTFSGTTVSAAIWTPFLRKLRDTVSQITGSTFNFVLVNRYKDGNDHIGEHKDDEKDLVKESPIVSLSFGEARDFVFRHQDARGSTASRRIDRVQLVLEPGSILVMRNPTNSFWYHSLPKRKKCLAPRINLTFRHMH